MPYRVVQPNGKDRTRETAWICSCATPGGVMRKTLAVVIASLGLFVQASSVRAAQSAEWMLYGPTAISCGAFTVSTGGRRNELEWWLLGFVSGVGNAGVQMRGSDSEGIKGLAVKHCRERPQDRLAQAAIAVVAELRRTTPR